jgi:hypothetical protein
LSLNSHLMPLFLQGDCESCCDYLQNWNVYSHCVIFRVALSTKTCSIKCPGTAHHKWEAVQFLCSFAKYVYFCTMFCNSVIIFYRVMNFCQEINVFICTLYTCS